MTKFIVLGADYVVREVVEAEVAVGFTAAPRPDIEVGDALTEGEKVELGLIPPPLPEESA